MVKMVHFMLCGMCSVVSNSLQLHGLQSTNGPLSMGFSRQEYWSGLLFPTPGILCGCHCNFKNGEYTNQNKDYIFTTNQTHPAAPIVDQRIQAEGGAQGFLLGAGPG